MHDLIMFKDAVICDLITVASEPPVILRCSRPAGPLEESATLFSTLPTLLTAYCSQFWGTRVDAKLKTSRRIISCGLAAACVPFRRESNSISLQGNSQCIEEVSSFHL